LLAITEYRIFHFHCELMETATALPAQPADPPLYHETQRLAHCAIHSLNNLFQENWLDYKDLSSIASDLHTLDRSNGMASLFTLNPYMSALPFMGSFDIQCIATALKTKDCYISNHIALATALSPESLGFGDNDVIGVVINEEISFFFGLRTSHHWFPVLQKEGRFINLDSELRTPEVIETQAEFIEKLSNGIDKHHWQIFVIKRGSVEDNASSSSAVAEAPVVVP
jgi:hypothetical protein